MMDFFPLFRPTLFVPPNSLADCFYCFNHFFSSIFDKFPWDIIYTWWFPLFMLFIASFTSSSNSWVGSGFGSDFSVPISVSSTLIGCWYNSLQYSDHRSNTAFESVSRFPFLSSITVVWGCLVFVNSLTVLNTSLLFHLNVSFSILSHFCCSQFSFAFVISSLMAWSTFLYSSFHYMQFIFIENAFS